MGLEYGLRWQSAATTPLCCGSVFRPGLWSWIERYGKAAWRFRFPPHTTRAASSSVFLPLLHPMKEREGRGCAFLLMPLSSFLSPLVPHGARRQA